MCVCVFVREGKDTVLLVTGEESKPVAYDRNRYEKKPEYLSYCISSHKNHTHTMFMQFSSKGSNIPVFVHLCMCMNMI